MDNTTLNVRRRTRMISFRVTDREFEQLKTRLEAEGARSISDYVRLTLCGPPIVSNGRGEAELQQLSGEIQRLTADVRRVAELLGDGSESKPAKDGKDGRRAAAPERSAPAGVAASSAGRKNGNGHAE